MFLAVRAYILSFVFLIFVFTIVRVRGGQTAQTIICFTISQPGVIKFIKVLRSHFGSSHARLTSLVHTGTQIFSLKNSRMIAIKPISILILLISGPTYPADATMTRKEREALAQQAKEEIQKQAANQLTVRSSGYAASVVPMLPICETSAGSSASFSGLHPPAKKPAEPPAKPQAPMASVMPGGIPAFAPTISQTAFVEVIEFDPEGEDACSPLKKPRLPETESPATDTSPPPPRMTWSEFLAPSWLRQERFATLSKSAPAETKTP